jgi:hypothetical protein
MFDLYLNATNMKQFILLMTAVVLLSSTGMAESTTFAAYGKGNHKKTAKHKKFKAQKSLHAQAMGHRKSGDPTYK